MLAATNGGGAVGASDLAAQAVAGLPTPSMLVPALLQCPSPISSPVLSPEASPHLELNLEQQAQPHAQPHSQQSLTPVQQFEPAFSVAEQSMVDQSHIEESPDIQQSATRASRVLESHFSQSKSGGGNGSGGSGVSWAAQFGVAADDVLQFQHAAPSTADVKNTLGITQNGAAFYGTKSDAPVFPFVYGGRQHRVKSRDPASLPPFEINVDPSYPRLKSWIVYEGSFDAPTNSRVRLEYAQPSPKTSEVRSWAHSKGLLGGSGSGSGGSSSNSSGQQPSSHQTFQLVSLGTPPKSEVPEMSLCALEVFAVNGPLQAASAARDPLVAVFYRFDGVVKRRSSEEGVYHFDDDVVVDDHHHHRGGERDHRGDGHAAEPEPVSGVITTSQRLVPDRPYAVHRVGDEAELLDQLVRLVLQHDPDILCGYETSSASWGYVRQRFSILRGGDLFFELGRGAPRRGDTLLAENGTVRGRHVLNLWQIMRKEVTFSKYSFEHVVLNALHERTPYFPNGTLSAWWTSPDQKSRSAVAAYYLGRVDFVLRLIAHFEIINRTCERSRIIGIDFMSSLTRGSQFQVESIMCRLSKRRNFVLISPGRAQVSEQNALEQIPLVMEPKSAFYTDPVCVLDFRSLYPSIIIAFNLCYSTCLGHVDHKTNNNNTVAVSEVSEDVATSSSNSRRRRLGVKRTFIPQLTSKLTPKDVYVAPNGVGYVSPSVRKSLLAEMLSEILDTRFMINDTRKRLAAGGNLDPRTDRNLNSQQLALKLIANVTYGYTSASFSGRMPCAELADSIVLAGRELLSWCITKTESMAQKWGLQPEVVYGDTDSLFVRFPNVSVEQAFLLGTELAEAVTAETPDPIHLKLEKVYSSSILLTKKRYVGRACEGGGQGSRFDAKGIETVRRDGVPILQKIERRALDIMFDTKDLSKVKQYLCNQWTRLLRGQTAAADFCFAREVKNIESVQDDVAVGEKDMAHLPGGAVVSLRAMESGEKAAPQHKERVSFVVTTGAPGSLIAERVMSLEEFMRARNAELDVDYYIRRVINPPLARLLSLAGANIEDWFNRMPRVVKLPWSSSRGYNANANANDNDNDNAYDNANGQARLRPRNFYARVECSEHQTAERRLAAAQITCRLCSGHVPGTALRHPCESVECAVYSEREAARADFELQLGASS